MSDKKTNEYFENLDVKAGDILTEMYSYWIRVIKVMPDGRIVSLEKDNLELKVYENDKEFKKYCSYGSIDGYWVTYLGNDMDRVESYIDTFKKKHKDIIDKRDLRITEIFYDI